VSVGEGGARKRIFFGWRCRVEWSGPRCVRACDDCCVCVSGGKVNLILFCFVLCDLICPNGGAKRGGERGGVWCEN
jgi:hypothetical protein